MPADHGEDRSVPLQQVLAGEVGGRVAGAGPGRRRQHQRPQARVRADDVGRAASGAASTWFTVVEQLVRPPRRWAPGRRRAPARSPARRSAPGRPARRAAAARRRSATASPGSGTVSAADGDAEPDARHDQVRAARGHQPDARRQPLRPHAGGVDHHARRGATNASPSARLTCTSAPSTAVTVGAGQHPRPVRARPSGPAPPPAGRRPTSWPSQKTTPPPPGAHARRQPGTTSSATPAGSTAASPGRRAPSSRTASPSAAAGRGERGHVPAGDVGHEERQRPDQVRRRRPHEDGALAGALPRQPDLAVRQVAQPAVHELRRPAAGARGEVGALEQHDREPAARGVQRDPGAGHPAADDDDVDRRRPRRPARSRARRSADSEPGSSGGHRDRSGRGTGRL